MQPSSGSITANSDMDFDTERVVEADADIGNASNFTVGIKLFGFTSGINLNSIRFLQREFIKPRSFAIMCGAIPNRRRQQKRTLNYGERVDGDFLVRFERHQVKARASAFPSHAFDFFDGSININYVKLTIDVSCNSVVTAPKIQNQFSFLYSHPRPLYSPIRSFSTSINSLLEFLERTLTPSLRKCIFTARKYEWRITGKFLLIKLCWKGMNWMAKNPDFDTFIAGMQNAQAHCTYILAKYDQSSVPVHVHQQFHFRIAFWRIIIIEIKLVI